MSTLSVRLPESLHKRLKDIAEKEGVSINQLITVAVAEKLSALMTADYLEERAARPSWSVRSSPGEGTQCAAGRRRQIGEWFGPRERGPPSSALLSFSRCLHQCAPLAKRRSRVTRPAICNRAWRAHRHDLAAARASFGAQVNHPIGRCDDVELMLDHHHGMAAIGQTVEDQEQPLDVGEMEARRRLVEDVKCPAGGRAPSSAASLTRRLSPPERVVLDCPSVT